MQQSKISNLQEYLDVFQKYKWHGLIPGCAVMLVLAVASLFLPNVYKSTCLIEVDRGTIENPLRKQSEQLPSLAQHLTAFSENALRWDILSRVVDKVGIERISKNSDLYNIGKRREKVGAKGASSSQTDYAGAEAVVGLLRNTIEFKQRPPRFLAIEYRGVNSSVNAEILNTLVSAIIQEQTASELNRAGRNYAFIKSEMENYRQKLEEAEARLKEFKEHHIAELPDNINVNLNQLTSDKSELLACELEMKELTTRINYIEQELKKHSELIVSEVKREANPMLVVLNQRIVDMEVELTRLRTNYTELHPRVIELKGQLDDLKRQRDSVQESTLDSETSMLNPAYQRLTQDKQETLLRLEVLKNRIANLKKRVAETEKKVQSMPEQEQQLVTLTRNYEVTSNIYNMFLQKLEEVRLQEKLVADEKGKESFRVIEYARATIIPVGPNTIRMAGIILLAGMATSAGIMALLSLLDDSFKSVEEAKEFIGKPLLGSVPSLTVGDGNGNLPVHRKWLKTISKSRSKSSGLD